MKKAILLTLIIITVASTALAQKKVRMCGAYPRGANLITLATPFVTEEDARIWLKREFAEQHIYFDTYDPEISFVQTKPFSGWKEITTLRLDVFFKKQDDNSIIIEIAPFYIFNIEAGFYAYGAMVKTSDKSYARLENVGMLKDRRRDTFHRLMIDKIYKMDLKHCTVTVGVE